MESKQTPSHSHCRGSKNQVTESSVRKKTKRISSLRVDKSQTPTLKTEEIFSSDVRPAPRKSPRLSDQEREFAKEFSHLKVSEKSSSPKHGRRVMRSQSAVPSSESRTSTRKKIHSRPKSGFAKVSSASGKYSRPKATNSIAAKINIEVDEFANVGDEIEEIPWAVTEVFDGSCLLSPKEAVKKESFLSLAITSGDTEYVPHIAIEDVDDEGSSDKLTESQIRSKQLKEAVIELMNQPSPREEEYDTDLEEEFIPEPPQKVDIAGVSVYLDECKVEGVEPTRHIVEHLTDKKFTMRHRYHSLRGILPLARALQKNAVIEVLDLSDNYLEGDGASAIAEMMLDNCYIIKLDLSQNQFKTPSVQILSKMLVKNYTLKTLSLRANHLTDKDAKLLADGLESNVTLTELDLSCNDLGEQAGIYLGQGLLANDGLVFLDLKWNAIHGKGIVGIANGLKGNSSLEILDLSQNGITLPGCQAFMRALKINQGLKVLNLCNNHINSEGARKLGIGLKKNNTLEILLMNSNPIGNDGLLALIKSLGLGTSGLRVLGLQDIPIPGATFDKLLELEAKIGIMILHLDSDGKKKFIPPSHVTTMVDQFIKQNLTGFLHCLLLLEENQSGMLSPNDVIQALMNAGIEMSQIHLETAMKDVGAHQLPHVSFLKLLDGLAALQSYKPKMQDVSSWKLGSLKVESNKR